jgi:Ran GTPase-activating protein (RanGAP) involved in mRNA processing and transport
MSAADGAFDGLFKAKLRDNGIEFSDDDYKRFCIQIDRSFPRGILDLSGERIGINVLTKLTKVLRTAPFIRVFNFHGNLIRDHGIHSLRQLLVANARVTVLDIGCNDLSDRAVPCILDIIRGTHVESLQLGASHAGWHLNKFSIYSMCEIINAVRGASRITCLGLRGLVMSDRHGSKRQSIADDLAEFVANDTTLRSLIVSNNGFSLREEDVVTAQGLLLNDRVRYLDFRENSLADPVGLNFLAQLGQMTRLRYVDLRHCQLSAQAGKALSETMRLPNQISFLNLADNELGDSGVTDLLHVLVDLETLTELDVSGNHFGEDTAHVLSGFVANNAVIFSLNISRNSIGDRGALAIADSLAENDSLAIFNLSSCRIADAGAVAIAAALRTNTALTRLNMNDNFLSRESGYAMIEHLRCNEQLKRVDLSATQVDHFVVQAIASLRRRNVQLKKEIGLQPMKNEIIQLSIRRTQMPEVQSRLEALASQRSQLQAGVVTLQESIESTQSTADSNILHLRKQIQLSRDGIREERDQIGKIEQDGEKMMKEYDERYEDIVGNAEKERLLAKKADEQMAEIEAEMVANTQETEATRAELQGQIEQLKELIRRTKEQSMDPEFLRSYERPELPAFMTPPKEAFFLPDEIEDLRDIEEKEKQKGKKKKKRSKSPKGNRRKAIPEPHAEAEQPPDAPDPTESAPAAPAPALKKAKPVIKRPASARRKSPRRRVPRSPRSMFDFVDTTCRWRMRFVSFS